MHVNMVRVYEVLQYMGSSFTISQSAVDVTTSTLHRETPSPVLCALVIFTESFSHFEKERTQKYLRSSFSRRYATLCLMFLSRSLCREDGLCYKHLKGNWCGHRNLFQSILGKIISSHAHV